MSVDETQVKADALEVTDAALSTVLEVRSEEDNPESTALRVAITGSNGPEFSYDLFFKMILTKLDLKTTYIRWMN